MKKILSVALLLSSISFATFAQQTPKKDTHTDRKRTELVDKTAEEIAKKRTDHIDKEVKLTEKQRKDVYALYLKEAQATIESEEKASQNTRSVKGDTKKGANAEVNKLLTPEQQKVLADKKNDKSGKSQDGKKKVKGNGRTKN